MKIVFSVSKWSINLPLDNYICTINQGSILNSDLQNSRSAVEKKSGGRGDYKNDAQCMNDSHGCGAAASKEMK